MFEALRILILLTVGALIGWSASAYHHGLNINPWTANNDAQTAVNSAVAASGNIAAGERNTHDAVERVRLVYRTVRVDTDCPAGSGAVSSDITNRVRDAIAKASTSTDSATASVRASGDATLPTASN